MYPKNLLFQFPSGRWGFVGRVSAQLAYVNKDGTDINNALAEKLSQASIPSMLAKSRSFETKEAAIAKAKELGLEYTEQGG